MGFPSKVVVGSGRQMMEINQPWVRDLERLLQKAIPRSLSLMKKTAEEVEANARRLWPTRIVSPGARYVALLALQRGDRSTYNSILGKARARYQKAKSDPRRSRNKFQTIARITRDAVEIMVINTAKYSYYIRPLWPYEDVVNDEVKVRSPTHTLLFKPGMKPRLVEGLARQLADELARIEAGR